MGFWRSSVIIKDGSGIDFTFASQMSHEGSRYTSSVRILGLYNSIVYFILKNQNIISMPSKHLFLLVAHDSNLESYELGKGFLVSRAKLNGRLDDLLSSKVPRRRCEDCKTRPKPTGVSTR